MLLIDVYPSLAPVPFPDPLSIDSKLKPFSRQFPISPRVRPSLWVLLLLVDFDFDLSMQSEERV